LHAKVETMPARVTAVTGILDAILPQAEDQRRRLRSSCPARRTNKSSWRSGCRPMSSVRDSPEFFGETLQHGRQAGREDRWPDQRAWEISHSGHAFVIDFFRGVDDQAGTAVQFSADGPCCGSHPKATPNAAPAGRMEIMLPLKDEAGKERFLFLVLQFEKPLPRSPTGPRSRNWLSPFLNGFERFSL